MDRRAQPGAIHRREDRAHRGVESGVAEGRQAWSEQYSRVPGPSEAGARGNEPFHASMKYKVIKSAAHNFARSFASSLNWAESDYVMSHLLRAAIATRTQKYDIDLTKGTLTPSAGVSAGVRAAIGSQATRLPDLLRSQRLDPSRLSRPTMSVQFDIDRASVFEPPGE